MTQKNLLDNPTTDVITPAIKAAQKAAPGVAGAPAIFTRWIEYAQKHLLGRRIIAVRYLTKAECENLGWYESALCIHLDDGTLLFPSSDDEGNGGGSLFGQSEKNGDLTFPVIGAHHWKE